MNRFTSRCLPISRWIQTTVNNDLIFAEGRVPCHVSLESLLRYKNSCRVKEQCPTWRRYRMLHPPHHHLTHAPNFECRRWHRWVCKAMQPRLLKTCLCTSNQSVHFGEPSIHVASPNGRLLLTESSHVCFIQKGQRAEYERSRTLREMAT